MQFIRVEKVNASVDESLEINAPKEVMDVFEKACYDCHSQKTIWPWYSNIAPFSWSVVSHVDDGRKWLDFTSWEKYNDEEKQKKLKGIYRTVYAAMPLSSYKFFHEEAQLSKEEIKMIRDWTGVRK